MDDLIVFFDMLTLWQNIKIVAYEEIIIVKVRFIGQRQYRKKLVPV